MSFVARRVRARYVLVALFLFNPLPRTQAEDALAPEVVLQEYRAALKTLEAHSTPLQVEGSYRSLGGLTMPGVPRKTGEHDTLISFALSNDCEKCSFSREESGKPYFNRVIVTNGDQGFLLRRNSLSEPYYLEDEMLGRSDKSFVENRRGLVANCEFCVAARTDWPSKVRSSDFQITKASRETVGEKTLYRIEFHFSEPKSSKASKAVSGSKVEYDGHDGWFRVDPESGWILQDYELRSRKAGAKVRGAGEPEVLTTSSGSITYRNADDSGSVVPSTISYRRVIELPDRKIEQGEEFQVTKWARVATPPEEFTLAYYGLGDFEKPGRPRGIPTAYWLAGLGAACLLISAVLAWATRYRSRVQTNAGAGT